MSFAVATAVVACLPVRFAAAAPQKPNILLIYTDDHSHRAVGCYPEAYDWVKTPNIDRLATQGVRFTHAYIGTWCMPSRATLLTGHHQTGVNSMRMAGKYPGSTYDPQQCPFWPKVFRENGYVTAQIGKWHTGTDTGAGRDWDHQIVWNRPRYASNAGHYYYDQILETNGGKGVLTPGYTTDNYAKWGSEFIRGKHRKAGKPWYLWVCFGAVHGPFTPAKRHLAALPGVKIPTPADIYPPRAGKPAYMQKIDFWERGPGGGPVMKGGSFQGKTVEGNKGIHGNRLVDWVRQYHQGVLAIDEAVGVLMKALDDSGQRNNTLVVFTSDQGFGWGQHGFCMKLAPYDATIRSPLIISMPGVTPAGAVCKARVAGVDLPPTFFKAAGLKLPWKMHGRDITPLIRKPQSNWPHPVLTAFTARSYGDATNRVPTSPDKLYLNGVPWWLSLAHGKYKYIRTLVKDEIEELYDLETDPEELTNLALQPEHAATLAKFRNNLIAELKRTGAGMADHLPPVKVITAKQ